MKALAFTLAHMRFVFRNVVRVTSLAVALVGVTGCGSGSSPSGSGGTGSSPPPPPPLPAVAYTVGGTVSGLKGLGLTLDIIALNYSRPKSIQRVSVLGDGEFVFPTSIFTNGPDAAHLTDYAWNYAAVITLNPYSPTQRCVLSDKYSFFTITANITDMSVVCGEFSYVTNAADNTISAFSVDAYAGALVSVGPPVAAGQLPYAIAITGDKKYLYVANSGSNDVSAFAVDPSSGNLTTISGSPFAAGTNPRALSLTSFLGQSYLYVANVDSDDLSGYRVDQRTGVLTPLSPATYTTGTGPSTMFIRPGQYGYGGTRPVIFTANSGSNDISAFEVINTGELRPQDGSPFPADISNVSSLAMAGGFLFAANANGDTATISGFNLEPSGFVVPGTIVLVSLPGFPYALPSCNYIAADQTGTYLYATAGTDLLGYSVDGNSGALALLPGFPVAVGASADSVSIDPTNQFLYVRNGSAGTVTGFELNDATGELTPMSGSPFAVGKSADFIATF